MSMNYGIYSLLGPVSSSFLFSFEFVFVERDKALSA